MTADAIVAISAAVVAFVQIAKWGGLRDAWGPIVVIGFSGVGVFVWLFSQAAFPPARTDTWPIFAGWLSVALSSAGVFGFTRAGASAVTRATAPPSDGAGSSATTDPPVDGSQLTAEQIAAALDRLRSERVMARLHALAGDPMPPSVDRPASALSGTPAPGAPVTMGGG